VEFFIVQNTSHGAEKETKILMKMRGCDKLELARVVLESIYHHEKHFSSSS